MREKFKLSLLLAIGLAFALATSAVVAINDLMALQGTANVTGINNITVTIWNSPTGGSMIYNSGTDFVNAVRNGRYDLLLGSGSSELTLNYGQFYYIDISINGVDLDFNGTERQMFKSNIGNITSLVLAPNSVTSANIVDGTIVDADVAVGTLDKNKINSTSQWAESEIPPLTSVWSGTLNASRIVSQTLITSGNSNALGGFASSVFFANDSSLSQRIEAVNTSKASTGNCAAGLVVQNITSSGVQCISPPAGAVGNPFNQILNTTSDVTFANVVARNISAQNISALNFYGSLAWSYLQSVPSYVRDYSSDINAKLNATDQRYNETTYINNQLSGKLDATDQRYNDTALIANKLDATDQRYNESDLVISLNQSKANIGNCAAGMVVQNITADGVQCIIPPTSGGNADGTGSWVNTSTITRTDEQVIYGNDHWLKSDQVESFRDELNYNPAAYNRITTAPVADTAYGYPSVMITPSAASAGGDGGLLAYGSGVTNIALINVSKIISFRTRARMNTLGILNASFMVGAFRTATSVNMATAATGAFFYANRTEYANWTVSLCNSGTCIRNITRFPANNTTVWYNFTIVTDNRDNTKANWYAFYINSELWGNYSASSANAPTAKVSAIGNWVEAVNATAYRMAVDYYEVNMWKDYS